jgi:hypothetical protein
MKTNKKVIESINILVDNLFNQLGFYNAYAVISNYSEKYKGIMLYVLISKYK